MREPRPCFHGSRGGHGDTECRSVGALHNRMPVILAEEDWAKWLGEVPPTNDELKALLVPFKDDALSMWPVNRQKVGNVRNKDREVAEPEALDALPGS